MTDREKAIVMAYTGTVMLTGDKLSIFYDYLAELENRPVYTHEISLRANDIKKAAEADFIELCKSNDVEKTITDNKKTLVINLFGAPGCGKSTGAAYIFYKLKIAGVNVELVTEFAKDKVWEDSESVFKNQTYLFGEQAFRIARCADKVDVIVTDSPLPLSILYNNDKKLTENFNKSVMDVFNCYDNINFLIKRVKEYNNVGRFQTKQEADTLHTEIENMLKTRNIEFIDGIEGSEEGYQRMFEIIMEYIKGE